MQFPPKKIILASNNIGKIKEFKDIFANLAIDIIPQFEINIPEVEEPYLSFIENSLHKARHCAKHSGQMALADDSGLCVSALGGKPGIYSARYAGEPKNDELNNKKLIMDLDGIKDRRAYFYCSLVLVRDEFDPQPIIAEGLIEGEIIDIPIGNGGFGYDPHFYLKQYDKTLAQLDSNLKNQISHRKIATSILLDKLKMSFSNEPQ